MDAFLPLTYTDTLAMYRIDRDLAKADQAAADKEAFDNAVSARVKVIVDGQLAQLAPGDLISGMHTSTQERDGATLQAAWLAGDAAYGAACKAIAVRSWFEDADGKAQDEILQEMG